MLLTTPVDTIPYETASEPEATDVDLFDESTQDTPPTTEPASEATADDTEERLWWDKVDTLGKIKDCSRLIQETEGEIDGYQDQIKEAKEVLKGQQALLARYAAQLADILDGHPLPRNPKAPAGAEPTSEESDGDWQSTPTKDLLTGIKGMGAKKLDAICEAAPTAGKLQELRIEASTGCRDFREVLPKGCGETLADEIIFRLDDCIMKATAADEDEDEDEDDAGDGGRGISR